jgi:hypothetical protein
MLIMTQASERCERLIGHMQVILEGVYYSLFVWSFDYLAVETGSMEWLDACFAAVGFAREDSKVDDQ